MMPVHVFILCDFLCVAVEGMCFCFNVSVFQCNVMSLCQSDVDLQINISEVRCFERFHLDSRLLVSHANSFVSELQCCVAVCPGAADIVYNLQYRFRLAADVSVSVCVCVCVSVFVFVCVCVCVRCLVLMMHGMTFSGVESVVASESQHVQHVVISLTQHLRWPRR